MYAQKKIDLATRYGLLCPNKQEQPATEKHIIIYKRYTDKRNEKSVSSDKRARKMHKHNTSLQKKTYTCILFVCNNIFMKT